MPYSLLVAFRLNMNINANTIIKRSNLLQKKGINRYFIGKMIRFYENNDFFCFKCLALAKPYRSSKVTSKEKKVSVKFLPSQ